MSLTEPVIEVARAKINLALHVIGRRPDGYHDLDSLVAFADVGDRLAFTAADAGVAIACDGPFGAALRRTGANLMGDAAELLKAAFPGRARGARIRLDKALPLASGLGGGSADAAATLRGLSRLWGLDCAADRLQVLGLKLGADVPVCLGSETCRMRGIGEAITAVPGFLPRPAVLVNPGFALATADVFRALGLEPGATGHPPIGDPARLEPLRNDLLAPALRMAPAIRHVLNEIERHSGVEVVRMSGSGPTCFGLFGSPDQARWAAEAIRTRHPGWWTAAVRIG